MPKGYLIANIAVKDMEKYQPYRDQAPAIVKKFGGRYIVRGGDLQKREGNIEPKLMAFLEFPSYQAAQDFYDSPEYQEIIGIRHEQTDSDVILVEGSDGP